MLEAKEDNVTSIFKRFDLFQYTRNKVIANENTAILLTRDEWYELLSFSIICENIMKTIDEVRGNEKRSNIDSLKKLYDQLLERNKTLINRYNF